MLAAAKVLLWAVIGLYDETLLLLKANVVWFIASLPLGVPLLLILVGLTPTDRQVGSGGLLLPLMVTGLLLLLIPNPASLGVYQLAAVMQRKESPPWHVFWRAARENVGLGLGLFCIGLIGLAILAVNATFYLTAEPQALRALTVVWFYLGLFWLALQLYLGPLAMLLGERRPLALYRRAALLVLAHPIYSFSFLLAIALVILLSVPVVPLYPALAMAFVALLGTRAVHELKRKYDPQPSPDEDPT
jgi:uncharacterized membrane protein YesL